MPVNDPPNEGYEKKETGVVVVSVLRSLFTSLYL